MQGGKGGREARRSKRCRGARGKGEARGVREWKADFSSEWCSLKRKGKLWLLPSSAPLGRNT